MGNHARLGPSNHRWVYCPGSVREESRYPDIPGAAAIDGTGSHELLELCLKNGVRAEQYDMQIIAANHPDQPMGWMVQPDRIERVQMALDYITRRCRELREQFPEASVQVLSESKSDPGVRFNRDDWWGTCDITIKVLNSHGDLLFLEVSDYKDGRGYVHVPDNSQLLSYILGKRFELKGGANTQYRIGVVQPKTNRVIRYEDINDEYLEKQHIKLIEAANATDDENAPLVSGKHCRWCKANPKRGGHCNAEIEKSMEKIVSVNVATINGNLFEQAESMFKDLESISDEKLADLMDAKSPLMSAFDRVQKEIESRIERGKHVPGYEMRPGRGSKVWNEDEKEIEKMLKAKRWKKSEIYPAKLISPAQVLKSESLTKQQRKNIEDKYISVKVSDDKLTKVGRDYIKVSNKDPETLFSFSKNNVKQDNKIALQHDESVIQSKSEVKPVFSFN
jgi:hypothetical protein